MDETTYNLKALKKPFSRVGLAFCAILLITTLLQGLMVTVPAMLWGEDNWLATSSWGKWIISFVPMYLAAVPIGLLILKKLPAEAPQDNPLSAKAFLSLIPILFCITYFGNMIGTFLSFILSGGNAQNNVEAYAMDTNPLKILVIVILAPLLEEYICRKQIIDRTRQYGEKVAIILSAAVFGLLHQNLFQFFYAFGLGLVFGYIYVRTGRLRYPILLHGIVNFVGAVIAPAILSLLNMEKLNSMDPNAAPEEMFAVISEMLPGLLALLAYALVQWGLAIAGLVLLILKAKQLTFKESPEPLPKEAAFRSVYLNVGMILYILLCCITTILSLVA